MSQKSKLKNFSRTEWILSELIGNPSESISIYGDPVIIKYKNKSAVTFNGSSDAIFLEEMPLADLTQFTIEVIFNPYSGGNFEQRFLHIGEANGDRVLLEIRSVQAGWYFDAFIRVGEQNKTLIEPNLLHPLDNWYHLAYVIDNGKLETFVNGKKELEGMIDPVSVQKGITSFGVRQNKVSWFKGAIYKIRITPKALSAKNFIRL